MRNFRHKPTRPITNPREKRRRCSQCPQLVLAEYLNDEGLCTRCVDQEPLFDEQVTA